MSGEVLPNRDAATVSSAAALVARVVGDTEDIVAVTGATGWLGSVALDLLYGTLGPAAPRRVVGYASTGRAVRVADGRRVLVRPLADLLLQDPRPTLLLHCAFLTRERVAEVGTDAYVRRNLGITAQVLAAIDAFAPLRVVLASSGAAVGRDGRRVADLDTDPYGTLKTVEELAVRAVAQESGSSAVIVRIYSLAGERMVKPEVYVLGDLIRMAAAGGPLRVRAGRPVYRSYAGADEVVALGLWAAVTGAATSFDTGGAAVEVGDLAALVAHHHGLDPDAVERTWDPTLPADRYGGDPDAMSHLAARAGLTLASMPDLIDRTAGWMAGHRD